MSSPSQLELTFGSTLIGLLVSGALYGITLGQTVTYYRRFRKKDRPFIRWLVFVLWVADTLHLALCTHTIYWYLVSNYLRPSALLETEWSINLQTDCNGFIGFLVECFFAWRTWRLSKNYFVTGCIVILASIHFGLGVVFTVKAFEIKEFSRYDTLLWIACTGLGSAAVADMLIAVTMCWYLYQSRTGFPSTDSMIKTLMLYSLNTGLLTSLIALSCVITYAVMPLTFVWMGLFWVLGKCYVNSFLATLNSREYIRQKVNDGGPSFIDMCDMQSKSRRPQNESQILPVQNSLPNKHSSSVHHGLESSSPIAVVVQTVTEYRTDFQTREMDSPTDHGKRTTSFEECTPISAWPLNRHDKIADSSQ
ncbi:uncharacterized protein STEHIDRAFT_125199 [Stereum hirsutum FP-91666 SS1]|uniref:uncharacterized protein n=1 Tax=Stereum hirsutum (strain FP-91666) TaxID=721885 RepID=UPI00044498CF|nr:uncharacterized protein STEHIDRAFT_125199 [Stereum hirsutum FP-91666 SS1]EIM81689.1 hypothetical protein STEHIDRAFT_125199 [Stereum hirsutum FP-91666 SS1]